MLRIKNFQSQRKKRPINIVIGSFMFHFTVALVKEEVALTISLRQIPVYMKRENYYYQALRWSVEGVSSSIATLVA